MTASQELALLRILDDADPESAALVRELIRRRDSMAALEEVTDNLAQLGQHMAATAAAQSSALNNYAQAVSRNAEFRSEVLALLKTPWGLGSLSVACLTAMVLTGFGHQALELAKAALPAMLAP